MPTRPVDEIKELKQLRSYIDELNVAYYDMDAPLITDAEYDLLLKRLEELEAKYPELVDQSSPTRQVGGSASSQLERVELWHPLLSLQDVFSYEEIWSFTADMREKFANPNFTVEEKIDGLSIGILYENGVFSLAHTRGDGHHYGENVSAHVRLIENLPLSIPKEISRLYLRGEIYMPVEAFIRLNENQEKKGERLFANPRNSAAGTMRQLNPNLVAERGLSYFIFDIMEIEGKSFVSDFEGLSWLEGLGFKVVPNIELCKTDTEIKSVIERIGQERDGLPYGIDGAVIKLDLLDQRNVLGATSKVPRWAVAYKYPPEVKETLLKNIDVQVGRTGRITPLAQLEPVLLSGSTVSRASLHNKAIVESLDVRPGDYVYVSKSGDIIPHILGINKDKRPAESQPWHMPNHCPECGSELESIDDSIDIYCTAYNCPAQISAKLIYFASKPCMDIMGLGNQTVEKLYQADYLHSLADIYDLKKYREELIADGMIGREKRVDSLLLAIEASKANDLWRLIAGLGIRHIGPNAARSLSRHFKYLDALKAASYEEFLLVPEIGRGSAESLLEFFEHEENQILIEEFRAHGLNFIDLSSDSSGLGPLQDKSIVLTGSLENYTRSEASKLIEEAGGQVRSSVSKNTDFLVVGADPGSKLTRAEELGVRVVSEVEFASLLRGDLN